MIKLTYIKNNCKLKDVVLLYERIVFSEQYFNEKLIQKIVLTSRGVQATTADFFYIKEMEVMNEIYNMKLSANEWVGKIIFKT